MILNKNNGVFYYTFPKLAEFPGVVHGIFGRQGGNSTGAYEGLNISFGVGDHNENVIKNRNAISNILDIKTIVSAKQVHGTDGIVIKKDADLDAWEKKEEDHVGDALMTRKKELLLMIKVADCQPVMLYDPKQQVIANIHSGWRGSVQNIIGHTIEAMQEKFRCNPGDLVAGVGPSLGPCCAEFIDYKKEIPEQYWNYKLRNNHFDLWAISQDQLRAAGVLRKNIDMSGICTRCHTDKFYSYRGEGTTGRFGAVIGLNSK